ncbi:MAG: GHKL domain-containing protein [Clostridiales bacterium]|jgi:two-component system phosphate regulon sensor histidine kinase PhoR|nr:GHKL domain-containing protein [Clostridiales bacterium]
MSETLYILLIYACLIVIIALAVSKHMLKKRASTLEKSGNELVSNIAHELKTPMTSIVGFVETLQSGAINDPHKAGRFLEIIAVESARLQNIIESTLELSRLDNLEHDKNKQEFDFDEVIAESINLLRQMANEEDIKIDVYYKNSEAVRVNANKVRMKQVIHNLVGNAIKYNKPQGKVDIIVGSRGKNLILQVYNTGNGIAYEHIPRLFERFYRVDDGRARDVGGTGLGLAIVKKIVDLYNGHIEVETQPGESVTFIVTLPIVM